MPMLTKQNVSFGRDYEEIPSPFELTKAKVEALMGDNKSQSCNRRGNRNTSELAIPLEKAERSKRIERASQERYICNRRT